MAWRSGTIGTTASLTICIFGLASIGCNHENKDSETAAPIAVGIDEAAQRQREIDQVRAAIAAGRLQEAEAAVRRLLVSKPDEPSIQVLFGELLSRQQKFGEARAWALEMSDANLPAATAVNWLEKAFFWSLESRDWAAAEKVARRSVEQFPKQPQSHRMLAQLLSAQGRRQEASESVRALLAMGAADAREILSLVDISGPFQLVSFDQWIDSSNAGLFALGRARQKYIADKDIDDAFELLEQLRREQPGRPSVEAFYGRMLAETNRNDEFASWSATVPDGIEDQADYWAAVGTWLQSSERDEESIAALAKATEINPTDRKALRLIVAALTRLGQGERAAAVQTSLAKLDSVFRKAALANAADAIEIGAVLESLVRPWEALGWYEVANQRGAGGVFGPEQRRGRAQTIRKWESEASREQLLLARNSKLLGFDPSDYRLSEQWLGLATADSGKGETKKKKPPLMFRDVANEAGIRTTFVSDYNLDALDFYLYQANGGGLAILDYDRDGRSDVYVVQSGGDPNVAASSAPNELYRQTESVLFTHVERNAGCDGRGYGQGVCAADLNQDGFLDLVIANIGRNQLLINQGDGTFRDRTETHFPSAAKWTSSIGVADFDGDALPDMIEVNYVDDPQVFQKKCRGEVIACVPQDFRSASDRFLTAKADGRFVVDDSIGGAAIPPNYGFGVVIADFDGQPGNEVFVSNDGDLNHYWRSNSTSGGPRLVEAAGISGTAVGAAGVAEACMGIASGDFDRNGRLDLAVTNFYKEPLDLFLQSPSGSFIDDAKRRGLDGPCRNLLGFGCQAADLDNDGWLDLSILNGHLYDFRHQDIPFQMEPQLFRGAEKQFDLEAITDEGSYFADKRLGRTLATGDIDRDGRIDLLANHLDAPVSLLLNGSGAGNWLQVQLVGRVSERDAVGAVVHVQCGDEAFTAWMTGGDGYMCTNEPALHVGIGEHQAIDQLIVRWPNGDSQSYDAVPINRRVLLIEGLGLASGE